jgi:hypothetical protein
MRISSSLPGRGVVGAALCVIFAGVAASQSRTGYDDFVALFRQWREFQKPKVVNGVPDYSAGAMKLQREGLKIFQQRLNAIDIHAWTIPQKVDFNLVRAEMNGMEFDHRVLRPWSRDPSFFATINTAESDVPLREGHQVDGVLELWQYTFPLSVKDATEIRAKLDAVPALLVQARKDLTEDTKDLWTLGIYTKKQESTALANLQRQVTGDQPEVAAAADRARAAVDEFRGWLESKQKTMKGSSAIGIENYDWYLKNVHLVPYTWREELQIEQRELDRAMATLRLEQQHNRNLPPAPLPASADEYRQRENQAVDDFMKFMRDEQIFTVREYMHPARRAAPEAGGGRGLIPEERRDFFTQIMYRDSLPMKCHSIHWIEKQRMVEEAHPSPIRAVPALYNIWDGRSEGFATAWEEVMMHNGLFDKRPRARELIYLLVAMRCVRGIADLKLHSGEFTLDQAVQYIVSATPNGWFLADGTTLWEDIRIYAHQPSYGTTYIVGKVAFDKLLADKSRLAGPNFRFRDFMDQFFATGVIPLSLVRWEMTGLDDEAKALGLRM